MSNEKRVRDVMTRDVIVLREEDNLQCLEDEMGYFDMHHLPVVDGNKLVGIISHRDVLRLAVSAFAQNRATNAANESLLTNTFVAAVMQRDVKTIGPDATLREAASALGEARVGCLPVVDADNELLGIITDRDVLRAMVAEG